MITKRIRVGHGIVVCVPEFNHPIKIAERTAVLDILPGPARRGHRPLGDLDRARRLQCRSRLTKQTWESSWLSAEDVDVSVFLRRTVLVDAERAIPSEGLSRPHPPMWSRSRARARSWTPRTGGLQPRADVGGSPSRRRRSPRPPAHPALAIRSVTRQRHRGDVNFLYCHEDEKVGFETGRAGGNTVTIWRRSSSPGELYRRARTSPRTVAQLRRQATGPDANAQGGDGLCFGSRRASSTRCRAGSRSASTASTSSSTRTSSSRKPTCCRDPALREGSDAGVSASRWWPDHCSARSNRTPSRRCRGLENLDTERGRCRTRRCSSCRSRSAARRSRSCRARCTPVPFYVSIWFTRIGDAGGTVHARAATTVGRAGALRAASARRRGVDGGRRRRAA